MKCFHFLSCEETGEQRTQKSTPVLSTSASMSKDLKRSKSENVSDMSTESSSLKITNSVAFLSKRHGNLREFSYSELKTATKNFSRSLMLGEGGFGGVYRGVIKDSREKIDVAVKQLSRRGCQGHKEWVTEVNMLGVAEHPNLVKLLGYCAEDDERGIQRLLVYEYMQNRSVQDHLTRSMVQTPLSWSTRLKIARDAAQGLAYLHEGMDFQIIFRDFKSSNILLDDQWNAKLSDFGLARLGPSNGLSHVSTAVVGTIGYAAPEYIQTGRLTSKNDVWSYGVFLYELITGRRPIDRNRPKKEENLIEWVRPHLCDVRKFEMIIDPRLEGKYSLKCVMRLADVANQCLVRQPKKRPKISQVVAMVNQIVEGAELGRPQVPVKSNKPSEGCETSKREGVKQWLVDPLLQGWLIWRTWKTKIIVGIC